MSGTDGGRNGGGVPRARTEGGALLFLYATVADLVRRVRANDVSKNLLLLLPIAYLIIGVQLVVLARYDMNTVLAMLTTLKLSDLLLVIPAISVGGWLLVMAVGVFASGITQFQVNRWKDFPTFTLSKRLTFISSFIVVLAVSGLAIGLQPIPIACAFIALVVIVVTAGRVLAPMTPKFGHSGDIELGRPKTHQHVPLITLRVILYAIIFGTPVDDNTPIEAHKWRQDNSTSDLINTYFEPNAPGHRGRELFGFLVLLLVALTLGISLLTPRPWIASEQITLTYDAPAKAASRSLDSRIRYHQAAGLEPFVVGRVLGTSETTIYVLTAGSSPVVLRLSHDWVRAREVCAMQQSWWTEPLIHLTHRYRNCAAGYRTESVRDRLPTPVTTQPTRTTR